MKKTGIVIGIIAAVAFIAAVWVAGYYFYKTKGPAKTMSVVGLAEQDFESDLIVWDLNYSVRNMNMKDAYSMLKQQNNVVKEYLKSLSESKPTKVFGGGMAVVTPPYRPKTLEEAGNLAREYIKIKGET